MKARFFTLGHEASPSLVLNDVLNDENGCFQASDPVFILIDAQISGLAQQSPKKQITHCFGSILFYFNYSLECCTAHLETYLQKNVFRTMFNFQRHSCADVPRQLAAPPPYCGSPVPQRYPDLQESSDSDFTRKPDLASPPHS